MFKCEVCGKSFTRKDNRTRHMKIHMLQEKPLSDSILESSTSEMNKKLKLSSMNEKTMIKKIHCDLCGIDLDLNKYSGHLKSIQHKNNACEDVGNNIVKIGSAFKSRIISFRVKATNDEPNIEDFFNKNKCSVIKILENQLDILTTYKLNIELFAVYIKKTMDEFIKEVKSFNTKNKIVTKGSDLNSIYDEFCDKIIKKSEEFQERYSGWALQKINFLEININKYNPLKASSYIELPAKIKSKKAIVNIQNEDNMCFAWSVVAYLFPATHNPHRTTSYPHYSEILNLSGLCFPLKLRDIKIFEN